VGRTQGTWGLLASRTQLRAGRGESQFRRFRPSLRCMKLIRIDQTAGQKRGRADAYYRNAIIEFDESATLKIHVDFLVFCCAVLCMTWQEAVRGFRGYPQILGESSGSNGVR
jgi:hypothetical protein